MSTQINNQPESVPDLSLVVALFFEQECIGEFVRCVRQQLDGSDISYEIVFVDDGSQDDTVALAVALTREDPRIRLVEFSRNHGKEAAISAGIEHAAGRYLLMMDVDLQDPPDRILDFYDKATTEDWDLVFGVREAKNDTLANKIFSALFWGFLNTMTGLDIPKNLAVMRIFSRRFAHEFLQFPERVRFIEGVFMLVGMRRTTLTIANNERFAGVSKFNFKRRIKLALNAIFAFSERPLRIASSIGILLMAASLGYGLFALFRKLITGVGLQGWTSTFLAVVCIGGLQLLLLGVVGEYIGRIYTETKRRPIYSVRELHNLGEPKAPGDQVP